MTSERTLPYDEQAERALLGALLTWPQRSAPDAFATLSGQDFHVPAHAALFDLIGTLWRKGDPIEAVLVVDEIRRSGAPIDPADVVPMMADATMGTAAVIEIIQRLSVARRVCHAAVAVLSEARAGQLGPVELVDFTRETLGEIDNPVGVHPEGLSTVSEFLATADLTPPPWVVPGLLRAGWRIIVVATEGLGKSVMFRQVAVAAAAGVHPFTFAPIPPVRTLVIDLENPDDAIAETLGAIHDQARQSATFDPSLAHVWRQPGGIDLRSRQGRATLTQVLQRTRPDLVCMGPLYKAYRKTGRESDEQVAGEIQAVLDDLRTRFEFALMLEHHAPKPAGGLAIRDLSPFGSSLWMRWPEMGLTMAPGDGERAAKTSAVIGRFRRDRVKSSWPNRLDRSRLWPWQGWWRDGMDR